MLMTGSRFEGFLKHTTDPGRRMDLIDEVLRPPEPQLLDTCVIQNLDWVDRQLEERGRIMWDDAALLGLSTQYGADMANDLVDLGILYKKFEFFGFYPWLVCETNFSEASLFRGDRGSRLRDILRFFDGHQEDLSGDSFPGIALGLLNGGKSARVSPLMLKGLGVNSVDDVFLCDGPLWFLRDEGDRRIAGHALLANVPVILTTDRNTFWKHRADLSEFGVEVMRPSDLLALYAPYWAALSVEFKRRRSDDPA